MRHASSAWCLSGFGSRRLLSAGPGASGGPGPRGFLKAFWGVRGDLVDPALASALGLKRKPKGTPKCSGYQLLLMSLNADPPINQPQLIIEGVSLRYVGVHHFWRETHPIDGVNISTHCSAMQRGPLLPIQLGYLESP